MQAPRKQIYASSKYTRRETLYLAECARDKGQALRQSVAVADAAALGAVQADGVNLVDVGHGAVPVATGSKKAQIIKRKNEIQKRCIKSNYETRKVHVQVKIQASTTI
jgi:hypothetical protein